MDGNPIVTIKDQHAALGMGTFEVAVFKGIARAIDAGTLAVPSREDPFISRARNSIQLLSAPHRRRRHILVQSRLEEDFGFLQPVFDRPQSQIHVTERRAAIARDEASGMEPPLPIDLLLQEEHAHQRLRAVQEYPSCPLRPLIV